MERGLKAFAFGLLAVGLTTACHHKDDPTPAEPEILETKPAAVEYYIQGTVLSDGEAKAGIKVKVKETTYTTDSNGEFEATVQQKGEYSIGINEASYLPVETKVVIADNAENRTAVKVSLALTTMSTPEKITAATGGTVEDNSPTNKDLPDTEEEMGNTAPDEVDETAPTAPMSIEIPPSAIPGEAADISVTTFVPTPETSTTVSTTEENKDVEKSTPLAAAEFKPDGLQFNTPVTISIPNPMPGVELPANATELTYFDSAKDQWVTQEQGVEAGEGVYKAEVTHFSAYAINVKTKVNAGAETVNKNEILGKSQVDNSQKIQAIRDVALTYKEKSGWEYESKDLAGDVTKQLPGANPKTINAIVEVLKKQMYQRMGSTSGITETERTYNTVNVSGYTLMTYNCYPKVRTIKVTLPVIFNGSNKNITISAKRYIGVKNEYNVKNFAPGHSGGGGGSEHSGGGSGSN
ncbi:MAG: carboxypeptidase-like regulatory domain-containing protein [Mediterranea sp.]|jgi:hypothetical protein|nr:carboxypeptidase-like regulatory domain-containing protein [Mediterranea sp.]